MRSVAFETGSQLTSIAPGCFRGCSNLETIRLPEGITFIGWQAFEYCTSLGSISLPASVATIRERAFNDCPSISNVYYPLESSDGISLGNDNADLTKATWHLGHTHVLAETIVHEPTCTEGGYTANVCVHGEAYEKYGFNDALGHNKRQRDAVEPTCTEAGHTEGLYCDRCGEWFSGRETASALGHEYRAPTIEFSVDEKTATATWTCEHDATHVETAACTVTSEITESATCENTGKTTYTATVAADEAKGLPAGIVSIALTDISAQGHEYVDGVCTRCGSLFGDVNASGAINIVDAQIAYDLSRGRYREHDYFNILWARANVNGDETVDAADARALQYFVHYGRMGN